MNLLARVKYLQITTSIFFFKPLTYYFVRKKTSERIEPQQNKADISTPFTFPAGLKFFHEISARKTKPKKPWKTSQKFSLPLTSASPQEHRTTTSVTHLQYSKFATCAFLSFKSNTDRMKRFSAKSGVPPGQNKYKRIQCPHAMHQWCRPSPAVRPSCGTLLYTKINLTSSVSGLFSVFQQKEQTLLAIMHTWLLHCVGQHTFSLYTDHFMGKNGKKYCINSKIAVSCSWVIARMDREGSGCGRDAQRLKCLQPTKACLLRWHTASGKQHSSRSPGQTQSSIFWFYFSILDAFLALPQPQTGARSSTASAQQAWVGFQRCNLSEKPP